MKHFLKLTILFLAFSSFKAYSQNNVYIVTEKFDGMVATAPTFDSVFVTTPTGVVTKYSIPNYVINPSGHDSQFNIILNGITSLGYRIMDMNWHEGISNTALAKPYGILRTIFLAQP